MIRLLLQKQSDLGMHCLPRSFWQATSVQNFRTFTVLIGNECFCEQKSSVGFHLRPNCCQSNCLWVCSIDLVLSGYQS